MRSLWHRAHWYSREILLWVADITIPLRHPVEMVRRMWRRLRYRNRVCGTCRHHGMGGDPLKCAAGMGSTADDDKCAAWQPEVKK